MQTSEYEYETLMTFLRRWKGALCLKADEGLSVLDLLFQQQTFEAIISLCAINHKGSLYQLNDMSSSISRLVLLLAFSFHPLFRWRALLLLETRTRYCLQNESRQHWDWTWIKIRRIFIFVLFLHHYIKISRYTRVIILRILHVTNPESKQK